MVSITWAYKAQHMNRECVSPGSGNTGITTRTLLSERRALGAFPQGRVMGNRTPTEQGSLDSVQSGLAAETGE